MADRTKFLEIRDLYLVDRYELQKRRLSSSPLLLLSLGLWLGGGETFLPVSFFVLID